MTRAKTLRIALHAAVTAGALAVMLAGGGPAFADDDERGHGRRPYERADHGRWERDRQVWEQREYHHVYAPPPVVYAPPPVVYVPPPPPPSINFIFPLEFH